MSTNLEVTVPETVTRTLYRRLDPAVLRDEELHARLCGVRRVVAHTVRVSTEACCFADCNGDQIHPTSIRIRGGGTVALRTRSLGHRSVHVIGPVFDKDEDHTLPPLPPLPWEVRPSFDPARPISTPVTDHLLDHEDRLGGAVTESELRVSLHEMATSVARRQVLLGKYWYPESRSWCFTAPLCLPSGRCVAVVLVPSASHTYEPITVLPLHEAFWNMVAVGLVPPTG